MRPTLPSLCTAMAAGSLLLASTSAAQYTITEIIDSSGSASPDFLNEAAQLAVDGLGNVYVTGRLSDNAFQIRPDGTITEIISSTGDGAGNTLDYCSAVAVDASGNVYVNGYFSDNVFKITDPGGANTIQMVLDSAGDGAGNTLITPSSLATDSAGNLYVSAWNSFNVFKITDPGGTNTVQEIIDSNGDNLGNTFARPNLDALTTDAAGNVYVTGYQTNNAFRITDPGGANVIEQIIDFSGDGAGTNLIQPNGIEVNAAGTVFVTGSNGPAIVFSITDPGGTNVVDVLMDATGDGMGTLFESGTALALDSAGDLYGGAFISNNAFKITDPGGANVIEEIIDTTGDGMGNTLVFTYGLDVDSTGNVYVAGITTDNVFKLAPDADADGIPDSVESALSCMDISISGDVTSVVLLPDGTIDFTIDDAGQAFAVSFPPGAGCESPTDVLSITVTEDPVEPKVLVSNSALPLGSTKSITLPWPNPALADRVVIRDDPDADLASLTSNDGTSVLAIPAGAGASNSLNVFGDLTAWTVTNNGDGSVTVSGLDNTAVGITRLNADCGAPLVFAESIRAGSPANPVAFLPAAGDGPVLGSDWRPAVDHTTFMPGAILDVMWIGATSTNFALAPYGTVLCDTIVPWQPVALSGDPFQFFVPADCGLAGVGLCTQAGSWNGSEILLTNALDITIGSLGGTLGYDEPCTPELQAACIAMGLDPCTVGTNSSDCGGPFEPCTPAVQAACYAQLLLPCTPGTGSADCGPPCICGAIEIANCLNQGLGFCTPGGSCECGPP